MRVNCVQRGRVVIASVEGRIDSSNASDFHDALLAGIGGDYSFVVLDLKRVEFLSSAGLRVILHLAKQCRERSGKLGVCSLSAKIQHLFAVSGLHNVIPIFATRIEALRSYARVPDRSSEDSDGAADFETVAGTLSDIAALTLEKYDFSSESGFTEQAREEFLKLLEAELRLYLEQGASQGMRIPDEEELLSVASGVLSRMLAAGGN